MLAGHETCIGSAHSRCMEVPERDAAKGTPQEMTPKGPTGLLNTLSRQRQATTISLPCAAPLPLSPQLVPAALLDAAKLEGRADGRATLEGRLKGGPNLKGGLKAGLMGGPN
jgi:hypothetical protein